MKTTSLLLAFTLYALAAVAQPVARGAIGLSFNTGMKIAPGDNLNWFPVFEAGGYGRLDPAQEGGLGFTGKVSLVSDPVRYSINRYRGFTLYQYNLCFEGQIIFPTKHENLKVLTGIGLDYLFKPGIGYGISSGSVNVSGMRMDLDSNMALVNEYRRKIMPSVSAGLVYQPLRNKRFSVYLVCKQHLLQLFTEDIPVAFYTDRNNYGVVSLNYRPTYLKLGANYDLW